RGQIVPRRRRQLAGRRGSCIIVHGHYLLGARGRVWFLDGHSLLRRATLVQFLDRRLAAGILRGQSGPGAGGSQKETGEDREPEVRASPTEGAPSQREHGAILKGQRLGAA